MGGFAIGFGMAIMVAIVTYFALEEFSVPSGRPSDNLSVKLDHSTELRSGAREGIY